MIIGDPYKFAFIVDEVSEWNIDESVYKLGLFFMGIDGKLFPPNLDTTTISHEVSSLYNIGMSSYALVTLPVSKDLFNKEKKQAFIDMFNLASPGCFNPEIDLDDPNLTNDYTYKASTTTMEDNRCYVFVVSDGVYVRVLATQIGIDRIENDEISYSLPNEISEVVLLKSDIIHYVTKLKNYYISL